MGDLLYTLGTLGFFAAMLGYVRGIRRGDRVRRRLRARAAAR
jgi:hypothetical protein